VSAQRQAIEFICGVAVDLRQAPAFSGRLWHDRQARDQERDRGLWKDWRSLGDDFHAAFQFLQRHKAVLLNPVCLEAFVRSETAPHCRKAIDGDCTGLLRLGPAIAHQLGTLCREGKGGAVDLELAVRCFGTAIDLGNTSSMLALAEIEFERGCAEKGLQLLERAAQRGDAPARVALGDLHYDGASVPRDLACALRWYEAAAEAGDVWRLARLGDMHADGQGTTADRAKAERCWHRAAEGLESRVDVSPRARGTLGRLYLEGKGVAKDPIRGEAMLLAAADAGDVSAASTLAACYATRSDPESRAKAAAWLCKAADAGNGWLLERAGDLLVDSAATDAQARAEACWKRAAAFYESAAPSQPAAAAQLGAMHRNGKGVAADVRQAVRWLSMAAAAGNGFARLQLGDICFDGWQVDRDEHEALQWYLAADQAGDSWWRLERIGDMYAAGQGTPADASRAQHFWSRAALGYERNAAANAWAAFSLGRLYADGRGVPRDLHRAEQWLRAASDAGFAGARDALSALLTNRGR
jgi:uncharacterized protein